jgi:hypothetical protein
VVLPEVQDAADQSANWAGKGVATAAMGKHFTAGAVFLVVDSERGACGAVQVVGGAGDQVKALLTNKQVDVAEAEGSGRTGKTVLPRTEEEEETQPGHVNDG